MLYNTFRILLFSTMNETLSFLSVYSDLEDSYKDYYLGTLSFIDLSRLFSARGKNSYGPILIVIFGMEL